MRRVRTRSHRDRRAVGVIIPCGRFWGTPSPSAQLSSGGSGIKPVCARNESRPLKGKGARARRRHSPPATSRSLLPIIPEETSPMLTLYYSPGACSLASHITLEESGAPYEAHPILLSKDENKTGSYLKINPRGKVPALRVGGEPLTENNAILTYLAKTYPQANL